MIEITAELQNGSRKSSTVEEACAVSLRFLGNNSDDTPKDSLDRYPEKSCGFDWFRIGDFNDVAFEECVGLTNVPFEPDMDMLNALQRTYKTLEGVYWRKGYQGKKMPYIVPVLSIGKGEKASFNILRDGKQSGDIFVESDLEDPSVYEFSETITAGELDYYIACLKTQDKVSLLKFYSDESKEEQCGELIIIPKSPLYRKDVKVVFYVVGLVNDSMDRIYDDMPTVLGPVIGENTLKYLDCSFSQAIVNIQSEKKEYKLNVHKEEIDCYYTKDKKDLDILKIEEILSLLETKEKASYSSLQEDCVKVYLMYDIPFRNKEGKNPQAFSVKGRNAIFCHNDVSPSTLVHEMGHALGLPHTFDYAANRIGRNIDNSIFFYYEEKKTDNFMDYYVNIDKRIANPRSLFYYWQWKVMNEKLRNITF